MILQALYRLAEREHLRQDPDYEYKPVAWLVRVGPGGRYIGIESTHWVPLEEQSRKKPRAVPKSFLIPKRLPSKSGIRPPADFFVDNAAYVFGMATRDKPDTDEAGLRMRTGFFREKVAECAEKTGDAGAAAVLAFLDGVRAGSIEVNLSEDTKSNDLFAFIFSPDIDSLVTERPLIKSYWKSLRAAEDSEGVKDHICLVSGNWCAPVEKHPKIKKLPGGNTSGTAIVSFNAAAFESYGWKVNENAPVSRDAAEASATALNRLLDTVCPDPRQPGQFLPRRNLRLSADTVLCYWAGEDSGEEFCSVFTGLLEANPEQVPNLYSAVWSGRPPQIDNPSAFYALILSGAQGRAVVRDWLESTVGQAAGHLAAYFNDLDLVRTSSVTQESLSAPSLPLRLLLQSLAPGGAEDQIPPSLAAQLIRAALNGWSFPLSILQRALERARAEIGRQAGEGLEPFKARQRADARAALIKAVLNRRRRFYPQTSAYPEVKREMDPNNSSPGYLLGRLMAVIERMQQLALGDINASVVDRFFSGASATPAAVFPRLLKNLRHHARKARDSEKSARSAGWLEKQVDEILARLEHFPAWLNLDQQGLFVLGYHQQRHEFWKKREDRTAESARSSENDLS